MGRHAQPERRAELLDACTRHVLDRGISGLSVTSMAEEAGTSPRMLIYHFDSKEQLVRLVLEEARRRQHKLFDGLLEPRAGTPYVTVLRKAWPQLTSPRAMPFHKLFRELHDLPAESSPWPEFAWQATFEWLPIVERGLKADSYRSPKYLATLIVAAVRGLLLDLHVTSERTRVDGAFEVLARFLDQGL